MPCIPLPIPTIPELPAGFGLGVETPALDIDPALCCKLLPFAIPIPPAPLGIPLNPAIVVALHGAQKVLQDFIDSLPLSCPRE